MVLSVSDSLSNVNEQIEAAARVLGRSNHRHKVFDKIYFGKKRIKTVSELVEKTGLNRKQVLTQGKKLVNNHIVDQVKYEGETAYQKIDFFHHNKEKILQLAEDPKKLANYPTKRKASPKGTITIDINTSQANVNQITIDDINSFKKVKEVEPDGMINREISESDFKNGVINILNEKGKFTDWGGEKNDLFTTRLKIDEKRYATAFAFKGPGTTGKLMPAKMGKNGDQIQRLFEVDADVFIVQYCGQIDESILEQMRNMAVAKSVMTQKIIYYCVIDGIDSKRIKGAYPEKFN